jgi:hypothetical protein
MPQAWQGRESNRSFQKSREERKWHEVNEQVIATARAIDAFSAVVDQATAVLKGAAPAASAPAR